MSSNEGQGEQGDGCRRHEPADLTHPLQIPEKDTGDQEQEDAQQDGQQLLGNGGGGGGGSDRQAQGGKEKGDGLHLKAGAPHAPQDETVNPHHRRQAQKGTRDQQGVDSLLGEQKLEAGKQLEQGEQDQGAPGGDGALGGAAAALRLLVGDGKEHGFHASQAEYVTQGDGGAAGLHRGPVDSGAAFGVQVVHRPPVVRGADEGSVLPGDHRIVEQHVGSGAAAQNILPVGQGLRGPVGQGEIGPYLRLRGGLDQAADDPHQHQNGQNGKKKAKDQGVPGEGDRVCLRQLPQGVQAGLEGSGQVRQGGLLSDETGMVGGFGIRILQAACLHKSAFAQNRGAEAKKWALCGADAVVPWTGAVSGCRGLKGEMRPLEQNARKKPSSFGGKRTVDLSGAE